MTTPRLLSERYELGDTLGYGGMSEVHRGRDVRLGREVAVKVLRADLARDPQFQLRFRREAQNAAALNHPAIVAVYDTGETESDFGSLPYIVMEYVDGQTLREIVKSEGPLSQRRVLEVMADVSAALDFSHRHGIIHRDVKPANVMITQGGAVKVMDFGIARALADGQNMTQTAAVIGTAQYLSPEQARGEAVDARSDVYAAGCVLFELLTGEPPFSGDSPVAVAYQHVREDVRRPSEVNPDVPPTLDAIVLKAMSKNPANRYQSAAEMREDLVRVLHGERPLAPQVMTDDERTAMLAGAASSMGAGSAAASGTAATRRIESGTTRHAAAPDWSAGTGGGRSTGKTVAIGVGIAAMLAVIVFVATKLFGSPTLEQMVVPNVAGQTQDSARTLLQDPQYDFKVNLAKEASNTVQPNQVIGTNPPAGSKLTKGSQINLVISTGAAQVTVPDLTGLTQQEAQARLQEFNLKMTVATRTKPTNDPSLVDKVAQQDPASKATVAGGSAVTVTIGAKQDTVPMPNVIGQLSDDAQVRLRDLGFTISTKSADGPGDPDRVLRSDPTPGSQVPRGGTVTLYVSRGNEVEMPNLKNMSADDAKKALKDAGFDGQIGYRVRDVDDPTQSGYVVDQSVKAGDGLDPDGEVELTVGQYRGGGGSGSSSPSHGNRGGGN
ncbi:Stk1 family PASTA domain-containing Ser/Thr kinase [Pseudonocardia eucalypti]|uniref:non-specific serine/threonine protein kinase n=1 Tax=Pseudonocardia eucalypti TaxID=648755 RepID=A0ABP9PD29_9PSEU|nr:serine/threonine-protein kinase [Pseudonocardia eucalypti]